MASLVLNTFTYKGIDCQLVYGQDDMKYKLNATSGEHTAQEIAEILNKKRFRNKIDKMFEEVVNEYSQEIIEDFDLISKELQSTIYLPHIDR